MQDFKQKSSIPHALEDQLYNYSNSKFINFDEDNQQEKYKEKQALNQLRLLSEFAEFNESFGAWGEESMVNQGDDQKVNGNNQNQKNGRQNLSQKQKTMFKNTLNEMSIALNNLEKGSKIKKASQQKIGNYNFSGNNGNAKQKAKVIEYEFDSADIISDLKKLRDDLQDSPDRIAKIRDVSTGSNIIHVQQCVTQQSQRREKQITQLSLNEESLNLNNQNNNLILINEDLSIQDYYPTQRSRSISTKTYQRVRKDQQPPQAQLKSSVANLKTQESGILFNNQYSNLLGCGGLNNSQNIVQSKQQTISNVKYPVNGCNIGNNQIPNQNQERGVLYFIQKMKSNNQNKNKTKETTNHQHLQQYTSGIITAVSETAPATPQTQNNMVLKNNQNFIIQKKKGRQSLDLDAQKSSRQQNSIQQNQQSNNQFDLTKNDSVIHEDQNKGINQKQDELNYQKRHYSQGLINEGRQYVVPIFESGKKLDINDNLKNYKINLSNKKDNHPSSVRQEQEQPVKEIDQDIKEEIYNFERCSKFLLKKSISTSFQQNDEISSTNRKDPNHLSFHNSASQRMSCNDININKQSDHLLIQDESGLDKITLNTQQTERNIVETEGRKKSINQQVSNQLSQQELLKIKFFERVKNKIAQASSSHRVTRYQNSNKCSNQQNITLSINQTPSISQSVTPKYKNNINNNQNSSFSRAISNNNNNQRSQQKDTQNQRGSIIIKQITKNDTLLIDNNVSSLLTIKQNPLTKKLQKQEDENTPLCNQDQCNSRKIKSKFKVNDTNKVPIIQMLTNRISRESNLQMNYVLKERNINGSQLHLQQEKENFQYHPNEYKKASLSINTINNNFLDSAEQNSDSTPKNYLMQINISQSLQPQNQLENKSNLLHQQQSNNQIQMQLQKTSKQIRNIPKAPKSVLPKPKLSEISSENNQRNVV